MVTGIMFQLMQIFLNVFIQNFKIMNNYLGSADEFPSAQDNNLFQLSALLSANLYLAVIRLSWGEISTFAEFFF